MDTAVDYLYRMTEIMNEAVADFKQSSRDLSMIDLETQNLLHRIELTKFNASLGYQLALALKNLRVKRRAVKQKMELLQVFVSNIDDKNFEKVKEKLNNKLRQQSEFSYQPKILKPTDKDGSKKND